MTRLCSALSAVKHALAQSVISQAAGIACFRPLYDARSPWAGQARRQAFSLLLPVARYRESERERERERADSLCECFCSIVMQRASKRARERGGGRTSYGLSLDSMQLQRRECGGERERGECFAQPSPASPVTAAEEAAVEVGEGREEDRPSFPRTRESSADCTTTTSKRLSI